MKKFSMLSEDGFYNPAAEAVNIFSTVQKHLCVILPIYTYILDI